MRRFAIVIVLLTGIACFSASIYAAVPRVINYQGRFTDKSGSPLSGNYLVTFRFYDVARGGLPLWEEGHILILNNGIFNVLLGSNKSLDIDFNKDLWLGVEVASDGEMSPRIKLASSAYAMNTETIDMVESSQLMRNDVDAVMSGTLTLKKDLILKGNLKAPSRIVMSNGQGREYYLWMDNSGNLRLKQGQPSSDKDGAVIIKETPGIASARFIQGIILILLIVAVSILGLVSYSMRKK